MLLLTQQPPMVHWVSRAPQSSNGANTSVLVVTLPASCRPGPFKELVHAATAGFMVHQPVPWDVLLRSPRIKVHCVEVTKSSSDFDQHSNFFNRI